jgi:DNA-binding PadR family transcriptional regulator
MRPRAHSAQTLSVLLEFANDPTEWRHGYELCRDTGLKAGSMYPILMRLADRGLLETSWEQEPPGGRPPRHLYRLTRAGRAEAAALRHARGRSARPEARLRPAAENA